MTRYRVVFTVEFEVDAENRQDARDQGIELFTVDARSGDWEITYVGKEVGDDEEDVTDNSVDD